MSDDRRIWIEEPGMFGSLVACEFCGRRWYPIETEHARPWAEAHAERHGVAGVVPRVYDEAELACAEPMCWRRRVYSDGRCRACRERARRAARRAA